MTDITEGPELDARIGETMGLELEQLWHDGTMRFGTALPYSTDRKLVGMMMEWVAEKDPSVYLRKCGEKWGVCRTYRERFCDVETRIATLDSLPLALCAAVLAVGDDDA